MSKYKYIKTEFHHYETADKNESKYIRLTKSLLMNKNFLSLHNSSKVLYIYMRLWAYPKKEFNYTIGTGIAIVSKSTFLSCIKELEEKGFINIIYRNKYSNRMNVYEFSDRWYKN